MKKLLGSAAAAFAVLFLSVAPAGADAFSDLAREARPLSGPRALAALFWSLTEDCKGIQNDLRRRQCEGIRRVRAAQVAGRTFLMEAASSIVADKFDEKKRSVSLSVEACVLCGDGALMGGQRRFVLGEGRHRVKGGKIHAAEIQETSRTFEDEKAAAAWKADVLPRLRTQFLIRLPKQARPWKSRAGSGYKVEVVGFRVYDPCDGEVLAARPKSSRVRSDSSACPETPEEEAPEEPETASKEPEEAKPKKPAIPERLSPSQIKATMGEVREEAQKCFETYGVPGTARLKITISGAGKVSAIEQEGDFEGTPTGKCVQKLVEEVEFPRSQKKRTTIDYPIMLR